jgi:hypothetical protein
MRQSGQRQRVGLQAMRGVEYYDRFWLHAFSEIEEVLNQLIGGGVHILAFSSGTDYYRSTASNGVVKRWSDQEARRLGSSTSSNSASTIRSSAGPAVALDPVSVWADRRTASSMRIAALDNASMPCRIRPASSPDIAVRGAATASSTSRRSASVSRSPCFQVLFGTVDQRVGLRSQIDPDDHGHSTPLPLARAEPPLPERRTHPSLTRLIRRGFILPLHPRQPRSLRRRMVVHVPWSCGMGEVTSSMVSTWHCRFTTICKPNKIGRPLSVVAVKIVRHYHE